MTHFDDLETVDLPRAFARALLAGAASEVVVVESRTSETSGGSTDGRHERTDRRRGVVLYRVGRAFVAESVDRDGSTRHLGLAPAEGERYVERVGRDDGWTLLQITGSLAGDHREQEETEAGAGP